MLVDLGVNVNARGQCQRTALHVAALNGHSLMVKVLKQLGADVCAWDENGQTALHLAAGRGHVATVRVLVGMGADLQARDHNRDTALHEAVLQGHVDAVQALVELGADVGARGQNGRTALHVIAYNWKSAITNTPETPRSAPTARVVDTVQSLHSEVRCGHHYIALPSHALLSDA